jgi:hypothetical protein
MGINADVVSRYDMGSKKWTTLPPLPSGKNFTSIVSGAFDLAIDEDGSPFLLNSDNTWSLNPIAGAPASQMVVGREWAARLSLNHQFVEIWWPGAPAWVHANHSAAELFVGGEQTLAIKELSGLRRILATQTDLVNGQYVFDNMWNVESGPVSEMALYGSTTMPLVRLPINESSVQHDTAPLNGGSVWQSIGGAVNHIIGHSEQLFTTSGLLE